MTKPASLQTDDSKQSFRSFRRLTRRLWNSTSTMIGATLLLFIILAAVFAPYITSYDPVLISTADRLQPPSSEHIFGTDDFGRDILTRVLYGGRLSLMVGLTSVAIGSLSGILLGVVAGYYGSWVDVIIMRFIDVILSFPSILAALVIVAILGRGLSNVVIAVGISQIPFMTRVVRASTLSTKEMDFVLAARAIGSNDFRIMLWHILPNIIAPIIVTITNSIAGAIIFAAALSFLGLGVQPPTPEWGVMLSEGRAYLRAATWITTFPGLAIVVTVMAINLLGDGLRDVLDPRLKME